MIEILPIWHLAFVDFAAVRGARTAVICLREKLSVIFACCYNLVCDYPACRRESQLQQRK
jgi:hypothetical protein